MRNKLNINCLSTLSIRTLALPSSPPAPLIGSVIQPACSSPTGSIAISGLPSSGTWSLTQYPSGVITKGTGSTAKISGLTEGAYSFTVTNATGCTSVSSISTSIIPAPNTPSALVAEKITNPPCDRKTGSVEITGLPDSGTWIITRMPGDITKTGTGNKTTISGLLSGKYSFTVKNDAGCISAPLSITIKDASVTPSAPLVETIIQPTCDTATGSISLTGLPALGTWTLTRTPDGVTTTGTGTKTIISGLVAGTYLFIVTNETGCVSTPSADIVINQAPLKPTAPLVEIIAQPSCAISSGTVVLSELPATGAWTLTRTPGGQTTTGSGVSDTIRNIPAGTYTYVVMSEGGCSSIGSNPFELLPLPQLTPRFDQIGPLCQSDVAPPLPNTSTNNISGSWNPATIDMEAIGKTTYSFTPDNQNCASKTTLEVTINKRIVPTFTQIAPLLQNDVAPALPDTSLNGITGTWSPATINTATMGTTTYTFKPSNWECATTATMDILVSANSLITGQTVTGLCKQVTLDASLSIGNIVKYEWSLLDQGGILDQLTGVKTNFRISPDYVGSLPADFRVRLVITNRNGSKSSDTIKITVDRPPVADITTLGSIEKDGVLFVDGSVSKGTLINYSWSTNSGNILGPNNKPIAKLQGAGIYKLDISDIHGCLDSKVFKFPLTLHYIVANPDYARIAWDQNAIIRVMDNDHSSEALLANKVSVIDPPKRGTATVNIDGTITYVPQGKNSGIDKFRYEICDELDLCDSTIVTIDIYDRGLQIPEGFSPNGDGLNDVLVFPGLPENHPKSQIYIYTRSGQQVYQSLDYNNDWNGKMSNQELVPTGTYYYVLKITYPETRIVKGFIFIGY